MLNRTVLTDQGTNQIGTAGSDRDVTLLHCPTSCNRGKSHGVVLGHIDNIRQVAAQTGKGFFKGFGHAQLLYVT